ncbi:uncharacterized protein LOC111037285 [Myzus persicae]|uniref:Chemosensory protein 9 n=1 Tax=Myzus persicae TaxID=13164 RepID=A0A2Z4EM48_MYZPE|nr:uncharacterized protein LOC111037285 [Myzus persicae]AWV63297.1 chemosensory protein 9 [Myzus persicae]
MTSFCLNSVILMTITTVIVAHAASTGMTAFNNRSGSDIHMAQRDYNENKADKAEGFFFTITNFFSRRKHDDDKPDFITTFDIIRLLDEKYAMKQFYCVINKEPCDATGLRLKATIPEEINNDCERCTATETSNIRRILNYVKKHYPEFWDRVEPIYRNNMTA